MQTVCRKCSNPLVVDDAKVPSGPFVLRCPKCQGTMKLQGKNAQTKSAEPAAAGPRQEGGTAAGPTNGASPLPPGGPGVRTGASNGEECARALVSLGPSGARQAVSALLGRQGYTVDLLDSVERLIHLQQGDYAVVVTERNGSNGPNGAGKTPNLYQRIHELAPELRRRLFVVLVGDDYKSGDPEQAFAAVADMVLNTKDAASSDGLLRHVLSERTRLFQAFLEVESRLDDQKL